MFTPPLPRVGLTKYGGTVGDGRLLVSRHDTLTKRSGKLIDARPGARGCKTSMTLSGRVRGFRGRRALCAGLAWHIIRASVHTKALNRSSHKKLRRGDSNK